MFYFAFHVCFYVGLILLTFCRPRCFKFKFQLLISFNLFLFKQIVEEAGGAVSCMDGGKFCVFDRSVLVSNGALHAKVR